MAFDVSTISNYIDSNKEQLIGKAIIGGKSISTFNPMVGVKGSSQLNLLYATAPLQVGTCGWNPLGTTTISKRVLSTGLFKTNVPFCDKDLVDTWLNYGVKVSVGQKTLPFEQEFINQNILAINKQLEEIAWQGDDSLTGVTHLKITDGLMKILTAESGSTVAASVSGKTLAANTIDAINAIVAAIPDAVISREDLVIYLSIGNYRKYVKALQDANLYHYNPADLSASMEVIVPGTNIKVMGVAGINLNTKAYATYAENIFVGTDVLNDAEKMEFWYSVDAAEFRFRTEANIGFQVAYPEFVVVWSE